MDEKSLTLLAAKAGDFEKAEVVDLDDQRATRSTEFIGVHCSEALKRQLQIFADIEKISLSQLIREVLQMEVLRLSRGETCSRELLMRERRQAILKKAE